MDRLIYLSMSGAKAAMHRQEVLANNLANVSTNGFRADLTAFRAVPVQGSGASTRVYALESTPGYNAEAGPVQATGRNLDVAMKGNAWLAVQAADGTEADYDRPIYLDKVLGKEQSMLSAARPLAEACGGDWRRTLARAGPPAATAT